MSTRKLSTDNSALIHQVNAGLYKKSEIDALFGIGVGNKKWVNLLAEGAFYPASFAVQDSYRNLDGQDNQWWFGFPEPYTIGGTHQLVITQTKIGIQLGDANDYITNTRWYGWTDHDTSNNFLGDADDKGAGGAEEDTWDHADTTIGGVYERIVLLLQTVNTGALDLRVSYVQVEYYYT